MSQERAAALPNIFPTLRYEDAPAAIDWLGRAFGFERHFVVPGPDGAIAHAQMRFGPGMIMLGSAREDEFRARTPHELGGCVMQSAYVQLDDIDGHYARAVAAGAEIVRPLSDTDYGSREYSARDPEGHLWHFGTYRPQSAP